MPTPWVFVLLQVYLKIQVSLTAKRGHEHPKMFLDLVDSARRVPDLAIYLIKNASDLFNNFEDDGTSFVERTPVTQVLRLHQSTDSGLSTDEPGDIMVRSSISPDSALFDSPMSESSLDEDHRHHGSGPRIEEIETIPSPESSKERTPVLSRENSDVYTFPHRYQWRSHLSADVVANGSRLMRQEAFRQVVSTQSSISSQDNEELPSLDEEIRVVRLPAGPSDSIPNVDELRVSDIIISHRKKESTDSTKTLIGRTDSNGYSSKSDYSGKFSTISSLEGRTSLGSTGGSPYISSLSSSSSSGSSYNYPRNNPPSSNTKTIPVVLQSPKASTKRPLLTKSDTLGLTSSKGTTTTTTTAVLTPLHRTHRLPPTANHGSLDRSHPSKGLSRVPLTREAAVYSQNSLDRKSTPYRPPKKTAAEIVLDQSLEVNWSVLSLRERFQTKDSKPAKIDTVYATLESLKKPFEATTAGSR